MQDTPQTPPVDWTVKPEITPSVDWSQQPHATPAPNVFTLPERSFTYDLNVDPLPYIGPRFEVTDPESFAQWNRENQREAREDFLNNGTINWGALGQIAIGKILRSVDTNPDPFEQMNRRFDGEIYNPRTDRWER